MLLQVQRLLCIAFLTLLVSCAPLPDLPSGSLVPGAFDLTGRFLVRFREGASSGRVQWRHSDPVDDLLITSPLGLGLARITRTDSRFDLKTADGQSFEANNAEDLTESVLGWRLPLTGLPHWVRGRPKPDSAAQAVSDASGRVVELRQEGWLIQFEDFSNAYPGRIHLSRPDLDLHLVIESIASGTP